MSDACSATTKWCERRAVLHMQLLDMAMCPFVRESCFSIYHVLVCV
jgi:hypothetical protein